MIRKYPPAVTDRKFNVLSLYILTRVVVLTCLYTGLALAESAPLDVNANWPRFRGPGGSGVSTAADIPTHWNGKTGEGILWKTPIPLSGRNSPIIWEGRVFCSGANEKTRKVYCFDAASGKSLWNSW